MSRSRLGGQYRYDIDGLRALAIVLVVFYHLGIPGFGGGFVGVDMFFAVSGYLIFSLICRERELTGRVDWSTFYARRVRRLVPELTVMLLTVTALGCFALSPLQGQQALAKSAIAGSVWLANLYFLRLDEADYFSPSVERNPLLHLWSLGVEAQFYLSIPLILWVMVGASREARWSWGRSTLVLGVTGLLSLGVSIWAVRSIPFAAYYLYPTRAYEFLVGGLAALLPTAQVPHGIQRRTVNVVSFLGLGTVAFSAVCFSMPRWSVSNGFGTAAGTAALLWSGSHAGDSFVSRALRTRQLVNLGRCSYGWYLWHFPLLVLWREYWLFDTSLVGTGAIALMSLGFGAVGYEFTQTSKSAVWRTGNSEVLRYGAIAAILTILVAGGVGAHAKYVGAQLPEMSQLRSRKADFYAPVHECFNSDVVGDSMLSNCTFGDPVGGVTLYLWGDSHANQMVPALDPIFRVHGIRGIERARPGCLPASHQSRMVDETNYADCKSFGDAVLREVTSARRFGPIGVILAARWGEYVNDRPLSNIDRALYQHDQAPGGAAVKESLQGIAERLSSLKIPLAILMQVPEQRNDVPTCLSRWSSEDCETSRIDEDAYLEGPRRVISKVAALTDSAAVDTIAPYLCAAGRCSVVQQGTVLYVDANHLSVQGARALTPLLIAPTIALSVKAKRLWLSSQSATNNDGSP